MANYLVVWEIDCDNVKSAKEAAFNAYKAMDVASVFKVINKKTKEEQVIDLANELQGEDFFEK